jgi:hypothetical protein
MQDGNIHCHVDNLSRANGKHGARIAVATAAYNAGQRLWSEREGRYVDFGNRADVILSRILLPEEAPGWAGVRKDLWNRVDTEAARKDARLAKSIEAAVTREVPEEMRPALLEEFVAPFVALGCVADIAIHEDGTGHNPHVHILLTTRFLTEDGFASKITALDQRAFVKNVRRRWAELTNTYLQKAGSTLRVDHRSYKARGIGAEPTQHRGPDATERRMKREHARRLREEQTMSNGKDRDERPSRIVARSSEPNDRDYDLELEQSLEERPPTAEERKEWDATREKARSEGHGPPPWWMQARENAHRKAAERHRQAFPTSDPERTSDRADYDRQIAIEAERLPLTEPEQSLLNALAPEQEQYREQIETLIHSRRIAALKARDDAQLIRDLSPNLTDQQRQALADYMAEQGTPDHERDHPVPGPDGDLLSPRERDLAEDRMLEDYQREEQERRR